MGTVLRKFEIPKALKRVKRLKSRGFLG